MRGGRKNTTSRMEMSSVTDERLEKKSSRHVMRHHPGRQKVRGKKAQANLAESWYCTCASSVTNYVIRPGSAEVEQRDLRCIVLPKSCNDGVVVSLLMYSIRTLFIILRTLKAGCTFPTHRQIMIQEPLNYRYRSSLTKIKQKIRDSMAIASAITSSFQRN